MRWLKYLTSRQKYIIVYFRKNATISIGCEALQKTQSRWKHGQVREESGMENYHKSEKETKDYIHRNNQTQDERQGKSWGKQNGTSRDAQPLYEKMATLRW